MNYEICISIAATVAAIASSIAAIASCIIGWNNFKHIKNKESANIAITSNFQYFNSFVNESKSFYEQFVKNHYINIQNLSSLPIDLVSIEFKDVTKFGKSELFEDSINNPEFSFKLGATEWYPNILKLQSYPPSLCQSFNSIDAKSQVKFELPLFMLQDFIQATYKMNTAKVFNIKRKANIIVTYYDMNKRDRVSKESHIFYHLNFNGVLQRIEFKIDPKIIKLT
ncbi:hypothetical protein [Mammaliicoccus lentus]|uniref:hypothetical protein n=1 Tax=Mammaliicoccus lentus TaxID=42858 RepID=UPI002DBE5746|nr:hypothetical protein [Mammaliicoccus lentus]MEB5686297.1 hypothetical protein [Mammaliicoccus lentus]